MSFQRLILSPANSGLTLEEISTLGSICAIRGTDMLPVEKVTMTELVMSAQQKNLTILKELVESLIRKGYVVA